MKQMIYQDTYKREILHSGKYKGYQFYIMNLGTHPTAYIEIPKKNKYNLKKYDEVDIKVYSGLSYSESYLWINEETELKDSWFIGWDYAHCDDYFGYEAKLPFEMRTNGKMWSTEEIFEDVKSVIEQLLKEEY